MSLLPWKLKSESITLTRIIPTPTNVAHLNNFTINLNVRTQAGPTIPLPNQIKTFHLEVRTGEGYVKHNYLWKILAGEL